MIEEFRWISGYEGLYKVSNLGRILMVERVDSIGRVLPELIKSTRKGVGGYTIVTLNKEGRKRTKLVHRLVAIAFIPNPENKPSVDHIDGTRDNNVVENLRWVTAAENNANEVTYKRLLEGTLANPISGSKNPYSRKISQYTIDGVFVKTYESTCLAAKEVKVCDTNIRMCANGKRKSAGGYVWKFESESRLKPSGKKLPVGYKGNHVLQISQSGEVVAEYVSIKNASQITGFDATSISRCIKGRYKTSNGFIWKLKD